MSIGTHTLLFAALLYIIFRCPCVMTDNCCQIPLYYSSALSLIHTSIYILISKVCSLWSGASVEWTSERDDAYTRTREGKQGQILCICHQNSKACICNHKNPKSGVSINTPLKKKKKWSTRSNSAYRHSHNIPVLSDC